jgi:hypothetical protein
MNVWFHIIKFKIQNAKIKMTNQNSKFLILHYHFEI